MTTLVSTRGAKREEVLVMGPTFLQGLQALECDLELVLVGELGGVVHDIDPEKRNDRHLEGVVGVLVSNQVVLR